MADFTLNITGNVAYADGSVDTYSAFNSGSDFEFAVGNSEDSDPVYQDVRTNQPAGQDGLDAFLADIAPRMISNFGGSTDAGELVGYTFKFSGNLVFDDGTISQFDWEIDSNGNLIDHTLGESQTGTSDGDAAVQEADTARLQAVIELLSSAAVVT